MKLTSTLINNPQGLPFTYINIITCIECGGYEGDMAQTKKVESDDKHLFHNNNIPLFTAHSFCWDCYNNS